ncbi:MAG: DedA family protein [Anaerolineae bacterium]|nr:DedA family protein [Anaerolineae bacterium]
MGELISQIAAFLENLVLTVGYPGIFAVLLVENIFTPIPSEPFLALAGILSARGEMQFWAAWFVSTIGAVVGSLILYAVGHWGGEPLARTLIRRVGRYVGITEPGLERGRELFNRYGAAFVFFGRWIPVSRPAVSVIAGMTRLSLPVFMLFTALSSALANVIWIGAGYVLGENWQTVISGISRFESALMVMGVVGLLMVVGWGAWRWRRVV